MYDPRLVSLGFFIGICASLTGVAILIIRGRAKPGVVAILIIIPFIFLFVFGRPILRGEMLVGYERFSRALIIGIISSVIGGLIVYGIAKK